MEDRDWLAHLPRRRQGRDNQLPGQPAPEVPARPAARRFAEVVCPPEVRVDQRTDRVLREFGLMLGSLPPAARKALAAALVLLDQGARLYPPSRGRRFARLDDRVAERLHPGSAGAARRRGRDDPAAQERGHHVLLRAARGAAGDRLRAGALTSRPSPGAAWSPTARRSARPKQTRAGTGEGQARGLWEQASRDRSERADRAGRGYRRSHPGVRGGDRRVGGRRGDRGRGAGRGGGGRDRARGGRVPPDRVVHRRDRAGAAHAVPGRRGRDGDRAPVRAVRRGPLRRRVHGGQRGHVVADAGPRAPAVGRTGGPAGDQRARTWTPTSPPSSPGFPSGCRIRRRSGGIPSCSRAAPRPGAGPWSRTEGTSCTARAPTAAAAAARPARNSQCW